MTHYLHFQNFPKFTLFQSKCFQDGRLRNVSVLAVHCKAASTDTFWREALFMSHYSYAKFFILSLTFKSRYKLHLYTK